MKNLTDNLDLSDWERYKKSGANDHFTEKNISGNDLNYLAAKGFEKAGITTADVSDVYKRINTKTYSAINLNAVFIGGLVVVAFVSAFFFLSNQKKSDSVISTQKENSLPQSRTTASTFIAESQPKVETPVAANEKKTSPWHKEHFSTKSIEQIYAEPVAEIPKEEIVDMEVKPVTTLSTQINSEIDLDQLPNAPVVQIRNFRITNFTLYYRKNNMKFVINNGGIDAQFPDVASYKANKLEMKEGTIKITADDVLLEAITSFESENYSACIESFDLLLKINKTDINALFYSGMCYYKLGNYSKAIEYLNAVIDDHNNIFDQESEYYKALSLIGNSEKAEAIEILKRIVIARGFYAERALEILKKK
ncbi:MAG: CDC27 family protein [Bacteroidia bacterium]|nr:CDC27 family protein [Bacteroidia bacterium]